MAIVTSQLGGLASGFVALRASFYLGIEPQVGIFDVSYGVGTLTGIGAYLGDVANALQTAVNGDLQGLTGTTVSIMGCKCGSLGVGTKPLSGIATSTSVGTVSGLLLPTQTSGIVTWLSETSGPAGRGRIYVPFPPVALLDTDYTPSSTYVAALTTLATALLVPRTITATGGGGTLVITPIIYHRSTHTVTLIDGFRANKLWATQKRRGDYGRPNSQVIT